MSVTESDEAADMGNNIACGEISAETDDPHQAAETVFGNPICKFKQKNKYKLHLTS